MPYRMTPSVRQMAIEVSGGSEGGMGVIAPPKAVEKNKKRGKRGKEKKKREKKRKRN